MIGWRRTYRRWRPANFARLVGLGRSSGSPDGGVKGRRVCDAYDPVLQTRCIKWASHQDRCQDEHGDSWRSPR